MYTRLHSSELQIWQFHLGDSDRLEAERLADLLAEDERERAGQFVFEKDRRSFVECRAALRILLHGYLGQRADDIVFAYSERGKPRLAGETDLRFNVSHSGALALFAFTRGCELGVDVEAVRAMKDMDSIAKRFFCFDEYRQLMLVAAAEKQAAFFRCWTRKEAYIKATGDGLSAGLDQFQVTFSASGAARFIHINHDVDEAAEWTLQNVVLDSPYVGAVAYRAAAKDVRMMERLSFNDLLTRLD